ncbi:MAG: radical SAM protein [Candidatus Heimdallarchaeota archaeon]|nr:MAG: radical SAM protein [Candidatus Heimdallarchaeota archaeon]
MFRFLRVNTDAIWENPVVVRRFQHYLGVFQGKKSARYLIVKKTPVNLSDLMDLSLSEMWEHHKQTRERFNKIESKIEKGQSTIQELDNPEISFLDLKVRIAKEIIQNCHFCERRCHVDRTKKELGFCRLADKSIVTSAFLHVGEEPPLIPSGTIFFIGCTFRCAFCQNWSISQKWGNIDNLNEGYFVTPVSLSKIMEKLAKEGAKNINWVGGDPTPNIHTILEALTHFQVNIIQLWNSNMFVSLEGMELLLDVMDFWLPDLKFFENGFAYEMTKAKSYKEVATRNIKKAYNNGFHEMIIRHLIMPGRVEADTLPILDWCAGNVERAFVNIMAQWRPEHKIHGNPRYNTLDRRVSSQEMDRARKYADQLGIRWREVH